MRNYKALYICTQKGCKRAYQVSCLRCRNEFHKEHSVKFISLEEFKSYWSSLLSNTDRKLAKLSGFFREIHSKLFRLQTVKLEITRAQLDFKNSMQQLLGQAEHLRQERTTAQQAVAALDEQLADFAGLETVN
jgi:hypothetical protein